MKFERCYTVFSITTDNINFVAVPLALPGGEPELYMESWASGNAYPIVILEGNVRLDQIAGEMETTSSPSGAAMLDAIMCVPPAARSGRVRIQPDLSWITVVFRSAQVFQYVTVKIREV